MPTTINSDGLLVRFGRDQGLRGAKAGVTTDTTKVNELTFTVDLEGPARTLFSTDRNNDGQVDGFGGLDTGLNPGVKILNADFLIVEPLAGGTNFTVGTFQENGTVIDDDGILTAAGTPGAQVGTQLSQQAFVAAKTTGVFTGGKVKVIVRYMIR